jgi:hypothetical protein
MPEHDEIGAQAFVGFGLATTCVLVRQDQIGVIKREVNEPALTEDDRAVVHLPREAPDPWNIAH